MRNAPSTSKRAGARAPFIHTRTHAHTQIHNNMHTHTFTRAYKSTGTHKLLARRLPLFPPQLLAQPQQLANGCVRPACEAVAAGIGPQAQPLLEPWTRELQGTQLRVAGTPGACAQLLRLPDLPQPLHRLAGKLEACRALPPGAIEGVCHNDLRVTRTGRQARVVNYVCCTTRPAKNRAGDLPCCFTTTASAEGTRSAEWQPDMLPALRS